MEKEINLPPFYDNQRVVFIGPQGNSKTILTRGEVYTVSTCEYKFGNKDHPIGKITKYWYVGIVGYENGGCFLSPSIFVPLIENKIIAMTFAEIVKNEQFEILLNN